MASLSFDVGMNIAGVRQGAEQIKAIVADLQSIQPIAAPSNRDVSNGSSGTDLAPTPGNSLVLFDREQHKEIVAAMNNLTAALRDNQQAGGSNRPSSGDRKDYKALKTVTKAVSQIANIGLGLYTMSMQGETTRINTRIKQYQADPYGAKITEMQGGATQAKTGWDTAGNAVGIGLSFIPGAGPIIGGLAKGLISSVANGVIEANTQLDIAKLQKEQTLVEQYKSRLDIQDESRRRFGGKIGDIQSSLLENSRGTGYDIDTFMSLANSLTRYGIDDVNSAGAYTRAAIKTERYTGADAQNVMNYLGTQYRYGQNAIRNMNYAYSAALESGLDRNQFGEFLDGLEGVIESGISKGYIKSTKEVSDTMVMFDKLSGGSKFWQGQQGFNRFNQISAGLSNATSLGNNSQLLAFQALSDVGGNPIDTFTLMEKGLSVGTFKKIAERFKNVFAGDSFSEISAWKELTGLNYTGAQQLYEMAHGNLSSITEGQLKQLQANPSTASEQTTVKDKLNTIAVTVSGFGGNYFQKYIDSLNQIVTSLRIESGGLSEVKAMAYEATHIRGKKVVDTPNIAAAALKKLSAAEFQGLMSNPNFRQQYINLSEEAKTSFDHTAYKQYQMDPTDENFNAFLKENERNKQEFISVIRKLNTLIENFDRKPVVMTK